MLKPLLKFNQNDVGSMRDFVRKMSIVSKQGCWEWKGYRDTHGYGVQQYQGRRWGAHRLSFHVFSGVIPKGLFICHHCDNPACVAPSHLFIGTQDDNMKDAVTKGRTYHPIGTLGSRCVLNEEKVKLIRARYVKNSRKASAYILAKIFSCSTQAIYNIVNGTTWKHVI
jgi:hypothetical protein